MRREQTNGDHNSYQRSRFDLAPSQHTLNPTLRPRFIPGPISFKDRMNASKPTHQTKAASVAPAISPSPTMPVAMPYRIAVSMCFGRRSFPGLDPLLPATCQPKPITCDL